MDLYFSEFRNLFLICGLMRNGWNQLKLLFQEGAAKGLDEAGIIFSLSVINFLKY
jgi:hypothetical protein